MIQSLFPRSVRCTEYGDVRKHMVKSGGSGREREEPEILQAEDLISESAAWKSFMTLSEEIRGAVLLVLRAFFC